MKMRWFDGSIAEAVTLSKQKGSVFVVYVEGTDEMSMKLRRFIDEDKIRNKLESEHFVAIKIDSGSEAYMQFAQIYQLVPLPSLFFIGKNGTPIQVVTGVISSSDELEQKLKIVLNSVGVKDIPSPEKFTGESSTSSSEKHTNSAATASASFIASEQAKSDSNFEVICEGDVCYKRPKAESPTLEATATTSNVETKVTDEPSTSKIETVSTEDVKAEVPTSVSPVSETEPADVIPSTSSPARAAVASAPSDTAVTSPAPPISQSVPAATEQSEVQREDDVTARVEQAKKIIEEKRKQKEEEEKRQQREREIRRRKEGQEMLNFKKTQREQELQQLKENIRRDKLEEQAARQRILEKIASDRAEQAKKFTTPEKPNPAPAETIQKPSTPVASSSSEFSRIQFRKPEGDTNTHTFKSSDNFQIVRDYVRDTLLAGSSVKEFALATTFPRREFTMVDDSKTLLDLGLCPSAVLLVIAGQRAANSPAAIVARSGGFVNVFNMVFWGLLSPVFAVFNYLRGWIFGRRPDSSAATSGAQKRANEETVADNDAAKKRNIDRLINRNYANDEAKASSSDPSKKDVPYRRIPGSNVHRLRETRDSDDENNTWNGNSTQQQ